MNWLERRWYSDRAAPFWLRPLEALFRYVSARKKADYMQQPDRVYRAPVPVIVVGNITVGGTGKTPVTLWLIETLRKAGYKPGVVSRGYGAKPPQTPFSVTADTLPAEGGDEPCMLVRRTGCPLVIDPNRPAAVRHLLEHNDCDLIISDDGLQHYALARDIEFAVIDAKRGLGNQHCMPAGPLREPAERLADVDFIIENGVSAPIWAEQKQALSPQLSTEPVAMQLAPTAFVALNSGAAGQKRCAISDWQRKKVHAAAGIGNPGRFFDTLRTAAGLEPVEHSFPDHHPYTQQDLQFSDDLPVVMTEKDAVKAAALDISDAWYLEVSAMLPPSFEAALLEQLSKLSLSRVSKR